MRRKSQKRTARLPRRDDFDVDRRQMEGAHFTGSDAGYQAVRRAEKIGRNVSQKVLTAQLRDREESGLVHREVYAEVPPRVEYSLTPLGKSLKPILDSLWNWGEEYKASLGV